MKDNIERLLVTGAPAALEGFLLRIAGAVNVIEQRGRTMLVTVVPGRYDDVLETAISLDLTLQRRSWEVPDGAPADDYWPVVNRGASPPWRAEKEGAL